MKTYKQSITKREFEFISSNRKERTHTFKVDGIKYRTFPMIQEEFDQSYWWTGNDWNQFMTTDEYYKLSKGYKSKLILIKQD